MKCHVSVIGICNEYDWKRENCSVTSVVVLVRQPTSAIKLRSRRDAEILSAPGAEPGFKDAIADSNFQSDITGVSTESTHYVADFACSSITLCNSSEGGSVGKKWFAQAFKMVPGSDVRAPLIDRLCGSEMDLDLPVKDSRALNESSVVTLA